MPGSAGEARADRWRRLSDIGQVVAGLAPLAGVALEARRRGGLSPALRREAATVVRTVLTARLCNSLLKLAARRPRPGAARTCAAGAGRPALEFVAGSFPSGHAATAAAGGVLWAHAFARRHPASPWRPWVGAAALGLAGLTAFGRVAGGRHYVSDVACGLALGAALGWGGASRRGARGSRAGAQHLHL